MGGPLIYFHEELLAYPSIVALIGNSFNLIHSYISTNIIHIQKIYYFDRYAEEIVRFTNYFKQGGNILVYKNNFKDIIGCNYVETGIFSYGLSEYMDTSTDMDLRHIYRFDQKQDFKYETNVFPPNTDLHRKLDVLNQKFEILKRSINY